MKIEQKKPEFHPVTITLESLEEVALLRAALGQMVGPKGNDMLYDIYHMLSDISPRGEYYKPVGSDIKIVEA